MRDTIRYVFAKSRDAIASSGIAITYIPQISRFDGFAFPYGVTPDDIRENNIIPMARFVQRNGETLLMPKDVIIDMIGRFASGQEGNPIFEAFNAYADKGWLSYDLKSGRYGPKQLTIEDQKLSL